MLDLGLLGFTSPWLLLALTALPVLWLLLRVTPPAPRRMRITNLFLKELVGAERTPARTPWWLLLLRMALAALLILALAGPLLNPAPRLGGSGPLLLVVDDGWASAEGWDQRVAVARELLQQAEREGREVLLLDTAAPPEGISGGMALQRLTARAALEALPGWQPRPWPVDRAAARAVLERAPDLGNATVVWLSDGLANSAEDQSAAERLGETLRRFGPVQVHADPVADQPLVLHLGEPGAVQLEARLVAVPAPTARDAEIVALGPTGESLARVPVTVPPGEAAAAAVLDVPADLRNRIARVELTPPQGIAGVFLLDERWRRRTVGLAGPARSSGDQPLLSELYFIDRALRPFAEVHEGPMPELLQQPLSLLVMADTGHIEPERAGQAGCVAGSRRRPAALRRPKLAAGADDLVPARLRAGDRILGGALSWSEPLTLAPFPPDSPFAGPRRQRRRQGEPAGVGGARPRPRCGHDGLARRRHPAGHRRPARQGLADPGPHHRQHRLDQPAALGPVRADARARVGAGPRRRRRGAPAARGQPGAGCVRPPRGTAGRAAGPRARCLRAGDAGAVPSARPLCTGRSARGWRCPDRGRPLRAQPAAGDPGTRAARPRGHRRRSRVLRPRCGARPGADTDLRRPAAGTGRSRHRVGPARPAVGADRWQRRRCSCSWPCPAPPRTPRPDDAKIVDLTHETRLAYVVTGDGAMSTRRAPQVCAG